VRGSRQPGVVVRSPQVTANATGRPGTSVRRSIVEALTQSLLDHSRVAPSSLQTTISWRAESRSRTHGWPLTLAITMRSTGWLPTRCTGWSSSAVAESIAFVQGTGPLAGTGTEGCAATEGRGVSSGRIRSLVVPGAAGWSADGDGVAGWGTDRDGTVAAENGPGRAEPGASLTGALLDDAVLDGAVLDGPVPDAALDGAVLDGGALDDAAPDDAVLDGPAPGGALDGAASDAGRPVGVDVPGACAVPPSVGSPSRAPSMTGPPRVVGAVPPVVGPPAGCGVVRAVPVGTRIAAGTGVEAGVPPAVRSTNAASAIAEASATNRRRQ
jgi:hypothetical protein